MTSDGHDAPAKLDPDAGRDNFDDFYRSEVPSLWAYLLRASGDRTLASDLLQESLLRYLGRAPESLAPEKRRPYLFRIASNLLRDAWRKRRREVPLPEEPGADIGLVAEPGASIDSARGLEAGMRRLRLVDRQLVWLAHVEELSHREIGELLGLREGSVKVMLFRARQRLAAALESGSDNSAETAR